MGCSRNPMNFLQAKNWLVKSALPLWLERGLDAKNGGFVESLTFEGAPQSLPRRCTVQTRQIYVFRTAVEKGLCEKAAGTAAVESGIDYLLRNYSLPSGAFVHSVHPEGDHAEATPDLYAQAFALFGMAHAYALLKRSDIKERAKTLLRYLRKERALPEGGFTELEKGQIVYRSNPHMHIFEAALEWMEIDSDPEWEELASDVLKLCLDRFVDPQTGLLGEYFSAGWQHIKENGKFIFEPGHQYEWSWLMGRFEGLSKKPLPSTLHSTRLRLFELAEKTGLDPVKRSVNDQMWSDFTPKLRSSRFWPQCERIKAASTLGKKESALESMQILARFFELPLLGLWYDTWEEDGRFTAANARASSLYHIMGGILEGQRFS